MSPIEITVNQEYVETLVNSRIDEVLDEDLSGITWSLDEFRFRLLNSEIGNDLLMKLLI